MMWKSSSFGFAAWPVGALMLAAAGDARGDPPFFQELPPPPGVTGSTHCNAISADGRTCVGWGGDPPTPVRWDARVPTALPLLPGYISGSALDVSGDGSTVLGDLNGLYPVLWTGGAPTLLPPPAPYESSYEALSADGQSIAGYYVTVGPVPFTAPVVLHGGLITVLPSSGIPAAISADGLTVAGGDQRWRFAAGSWTAEALPGTGENPVVEARGLSAHGEIVVGSCAAVYTSTACRWDGAGQVEVLGPPGSYTRATACSADGSVVVGSSGEPSLVNAAVIWDPVLGLWGIKDLLTTRYGLDLTGWTLESATDISADGRTIVGNGYSPAGQYRAWIAYLGDACYADCDTSGSLDFFDFLCFQNLFAAGDPGADCDGSGGHDFFDFLCFQNAFAAGCP